METHLTIIGFLLISLGLTHIVFPKYFNWKTELTYLSLINRQMMQVHTFYIALTVILMGVLCLTSQNELLTTNLGNKITFGLGIFWAIRLFFQFFVYSSKLWKGRKIETTIHLFFSLLWCYFSSIFLLISL